MTDLPLFLLINWTVRMGRLLRALYPFLFVQMKGTVMNAHTRWMPDSAAPAPNASEPRSVSTPAPRAGWREASASIAQAGDDRLVLPAFGNAMDKELKW